MKICWDNLNKLQYKNGVWKTPSKHMYVYAEECIQCHEPFLHRIYVEGQFCSNPCKSKHNSNSRWAGTELSDDRKNAILSQKMRKDYEVDSMPEVEIGSPNTIINIPRQVRRGRPAGHKLSQETKDRISAKRKGQKISERTKLKIMLSARGKAVPLNIKHRGIHDGTSFVDKQGYKCIYVGNKTYIREHRLIAEQVLGRPLKPNEYVYHIDGNRSNNNHNNLLICDSHYLGWLMNHDKPKPWMHKKKRRI